jgi:hypothetical protein
LTREEIKKFLEPYMQIKLRVGQVNGSGKDAYWPLIDAQGNDWAIIVIDPEFNSLSVLATTDTTRVLDPVRRATPVPAPQPAPAPSATPKNDCVIIAAENMKRLKDTAVWAKIFAYKMTVDQQPVPGHAVVVFKLTGDGPVLFVDAGGTGELRTTATDLESIREGMETRFMRTFKAYVEITEPKFLN